MADSTMTAWLKHTRSWWFLATTIVTLLSAWGWLPLHHLFAEPVWRVLYTLLGLGSVIVCATTWSYRVREELPKPASHMPFTPLGHRPR